MSDMRPARRNPTIELDWADGPHLFRLATYKELSELEGLCDLGVLEIFQALTTGKWRASHVRETIRIGLIGGGMTASKALALVSLYVDPGPIMDLANVNVATAVLLAGLMGNRPDEDVSDQAASDDQKKTTGSTSQTSTAPAPPSASHPDKSMN